MRFSPENHQELVAVFHVGAISLLSGIAHYYSSKVWYSVAFSCLAGEVANASDSMILCNGNLHTFLAQALTFSPETPYSLNTLHE